ncbi:MAG TPA: DJ-1/PfpI family protein [Capillimicrobium sp.]|jgi:putative intracellular protease/amidase
MPTTPQIVHLAVYDTLADWEVGHAAAHVNDPSHQREPGRYAVRTVAETAAPIVTMGGVRIDPDLTLDELDPAASAMLVLAGAHGWMTGGNGAFAEAARACLAAGTPVAAICGATFGLASAGLLDDRAHTSGAAEFLAMSGYAGGERYVDAPAVRDRGLITAGPAHPVAFAREILAELDAYAPEKLDAWHGLHTTGDPACYEALVA